MRTVEGVMEPLAVYVFLVILALAIVAAAALFSKPAKRRCPGCREDLAITARLCRRCGYAFS